MRFYFPDLTEATEMITLSEQESMHCIKVLRLKSGSSIQIVNGKGMLGEGVVSKANPKACVVLINSIEIEELKCNIHIALSPTKQMERLEWFFEKAVELGLNELTLLICQNNERNKVRIDRLEKIAISAMKQSKRLHLPKINPLTTLSNFLVSNPKGYIAHCSNSKKLNIREVQGILPILIGPEGDFTKEEIILANQFEYESLSLGDYRLRTETAALFAVSALNLLS